MNITKTSESRTVQTVVTTDQGTFIRVKFEPILKSGLKVTEKVTWYVAQDMDGIMCHRRRASDEKSMELECALAVHKST